MPERSAPAGGDFQYDLPPELIAQDPAPRRCDARLLLVERGGGVLGERHARDLPQLLRPGDLVVVNDSRVLPARLRARTEGGGRCEVLLVRPLRDGRWLALARPAHRLRPGTRLALADGADRLEVAANRGGGYVEVTGSRDPAALASAWGEAPLPPYIRREPGDDTPGAAERRRRDRERYQTVYAREDGSVAAPTAGLHFELAILEALRARGIALAAVTLHVGPGTFRPPGERELALGRLHAEEFVCTAETDAALREARDAGGRVVAVGTTTLRVLETVRRLRLEERSGDEVTCAEAGAGEAAPVFTGQARRAAAGWHVEGRTRLFLRPPAAVTAADALLTNFHLPGSSLLMLVAALAGEATWRAAYAHAVAARFRFYSYGDAMLILPPAACGATPEGGTHERA